MRMKKRTFITRITALIMAVLLAVGMLPNTMVRAEQPDVFDSYSDSNDLLEYYEVKPLTLLADNEEEPVVHYDDIALLSEQEDITVNSESELYKYLSKKMAERSTQINIILPNDINNSIGGPVNAYTNAIAYSGGRCYKIWWNRFSCFNRILFITIYEVFLHYDILYDS